MRATTGFGDRLATLCVSAKLSQRGLARRAGTSQAMIRQLECGSIRRTNAELALRLAQILGVDPELLVFGDSVDPSPPDTT